MSHTIFRMKGQTSRSHMSFQVLALSTPWLRPYLAESLHMWHSYNTWGDDVSCTIFRVKGQTSRPHGLLEAFTLSAPWLTPYLTESLHMCHTCNTWGSHVSCTIFCHLSALWLHANLTGLYGWGVPQLLDPYIYLLFLICGMNCFMCHLPTPKFIFVCHLELYNLWLCFVHKKHLTLVMWSSFFRSIYIYMCFLSFLYAEILQVVENPSMTRIKTLIVSWLLIVQGAQTRHRRFLVAASLSGFMPTRMTMLPAGIGSGNHAKITTYHCTTIVISNSLGHNLSIGTMIFSWQILFNL